MLKVLCRALLAGCVAIGAACQGSRSLRDPQYQWSQYTETSTKEVVALGQRLFFDPQLSGSGRTACATCHNPDFGICGLSAFQTMGKSYRRILVTEGVRRQRLELAIG